MEGRPWCFDNMLMLLKEAEVDEQPDQVTLNNSPFQIRLKNLPFNMRSNEIVIALIGNMGKILEIQEDVLGACGQISECESYARCPHPFKKILEDER